MSSQLIPKYLQKANKIYHHQNKQLWENSWIKGLVTDENKNPIQGVDVSAKLYKIEPDNTKTLYENIPPIQTDNTGHYKLILPIEKEIKILSVKLQFELK